VTKTQSAGPISCLEHRATKVLHCAIVTRAAVLMLPLLLQTIISNQMRPRRLRGAWFSRLLRHPAIDGVGLFQAPEPTWGYRVLGAVQVHFCMDYTISGKSLTLMLVVKLYRILRLGQIVGQTVYSYSTE